MYGIAGCEHKMGYLIDMKRHKVAKDVIGENVRRRYPMMERG